MNNIRLFDIREMEWKEDENGMRSCVFKPTHSMTMQYWEIKPGIGAPIHSHPHEQLIYIRQGRLDVTIDGETYELAEGCFCLVPSGAEHATYNPGPEYCINVDVFVPERDDRTESARINNLAHKNWP